MYRKFHVFVRCICLVFLLGACQRRNVENITVKGSDTEVNVALELAEAYMAKDENISIAVTGGGSGMGIASLINQKTDIANSSREFKSKEIQLAQARGVDPKPVIFAVDALALIVNPSVGVSTLTLKQIAKIYSGEITNWQQVGGKDVAISLYGRQSNSGTFVFFRESIIKGEYSSDLKQMNGTAQIIEAVKHDEGAIGYVGLGYIKDQNGKTLSGIKVVSIKENDGDIISPIANESIVRGDYPLTRPLFQYIDEDNLSQKLIDFLNFTLSKQGQKIVAKSGYFPINQKQKLHNQNLGIGL